MAAREAKKGETERDLSYRANSAGRADTDTHATPPPPPSQPLTEKHTAKTICASVYTQGRVMGCEVSIQYKTNTPTLAVLLPVDPCISVAWYDHRSLTLFSVDDSNCFTARNNTSGLPASYDSKPS